MEKNSDYILFRKNLLNFVKKDLEGPFDSDEILTESPIGRYATGVIFPQTAEDGKEDPETQIEEPETISRDDEEILVNDKTSTFYPSAMGLSFSVGDDINDLTVSISAAKYHKLLKDEYMFVSCPLESKPEKFLSDSLFCSLFVWADGTLKLIKPFEESDKELVIKLVIEDQKLKNAVNNLFYKYDRGFMRVPIKIQQPVTLVTTNKTYQLSGESLKLVCTVKNDLTNKVKFCTFSLVNVEKTGNVQTDHEKAYFQCKIEVRTINNVPVFNDLGKCVTRRGDKEDQALSMLYRKKKYYAAGHGCSVKWDSDSSGKATALYTETFPSFEVPSTVFELPESGGLDLPDLSMQQYAYQNSEWVCENLDKLVSIYKSWINDIRIQKAEMDPDMRLVADENITMCSEAADRMLSGVNLLRTNNMAMEAFKLANRAMLMQRVHTEIQKKKRFPDEACPMPVTYESESSKWRPFQIAFILTTLESIINNSSNYRDVVDLIWFPTGGGKTEAYLGLTALTIFFRRLSNKPDVSGGTTVIMRYTLRLLTSQQFQRACTLICACEKIRKDRNNLGNDPVSIGLWLGRKSTPNTVEEAKEKIKELNNKIYMDSGQNPFQVLRCPWCGTYMIRGDGRGVNCYRHRSRPSRISMWCPNTACDFNDELPIKVVDEDIYNSATTLLFGTVDKFALLPWHEETANIFALGKNSNHLLPPDLIIQDELHLISGALGTMVGIYETAIDLLCSAKGTKPKIIASTATIRRALEQCKALYARDIRQFPPPGLDSSDSFFARENPSNDSGRLYVGVMPSGKTSVTTEVRLLANIVQGVHFISGSNEVKDQYWTPVIYCNSIRELGASKSMIYDDVQEYSKRIQARYNKNKRYYSDTDVQELTSRIPAESIPDILERLSIPYPDNKKIELLLATNMISVGVDIDRLGLMVIVGQPKSTSEYIQASSRVGRKYPGIIFTLFSPVKSRDRSHYEQYLKYHQSYYKYVEPTSVTPFSPPARTKGLPAVVITLIRHLAGYHTDDDLAGFDVNSAGVNGIINEIIKRVSIVDPDEKVETERDLKQILSTIASHLRQTGESISYTSNRGKLPLMRPSDGDKQRGEYPVPQSMRNTDSECNINVDYSA